jgi:hypothetical protein
MHQEGTNAALFRNIIDVMPFLFSDDLIDGSTYASMFTNAGEGGPGTGCSVRLAFVGGNAHAWGASINLGPVNEGEVIDVVLSNATVAATLAVPNNGFIGFVATANEPVSSLLFRSATIDPGTAGEGFGMDNISMVIPEPAAFVAWIALGPVAWLKRRRRRRCL